MSYTPEIDLKLLLDAGVHFGHKTSRWNPKMASYIFGIRDNIHIIDLQQTLPLMRVALNKIHEVVKNHGKVLFVSSKVQASELISEYAEKCGQFYMNHRWLGGMMTNWSTISKSIKKLDNIEKKLADPELIATYTKKETLDLQRRKDKLMKSFAGIRNIGGRPDLIVIIDTNREHLAVTEANKLGIPVVAIVDSNSNPDRIQYPIPGNDDAIRSIKLYCQLFSDAALAGIEESLTDSGVDIGESSHVSKEAKKGMEGVKKLDTALKATTQQNTKISSTQPDSKGNKQTKAKVSKESKVVTKAKNTEEKKLEELQSKVDEKTSMKNDKTAIDSAKKDVKKSMTKKIDDSKKTINKANTIKSASEQKKASDSTTKLSKTQTKSTKDVKVSVTSDK